MPGAPNKPPETAPPPAPAGPVALETPEEHALRRLAPSRVALRLPIWKGAPSSDLLAPFAEAEEKFAQGDAKGSDGALDRLAIRFAEPRWPSLPEPFRGLRVPIPAPQPPHWDPEHALQAAEREARRFRRYAETQLALARATVAAETGQADGAIDALKSRLDAAAASLAANGPGPEFWGPVDELWRTVRARLPAPSPAAPRPPPPAVDDAG